ncbi:nuclear pore complex subunit [Ophidiomyces ophidiicola]|uniref:Nuclear pore complex subunit n=1 Tax=Ophidiomyces ophidiicola TaxID=1387563 RepID=A0ACB8UNH3_9EURO|nr:nuclear pore complex subunit [Ophidiomyces ophidiicola]KAI1945710.1 nuclear pore complex subunit [Ophidiomyces ophidiicola]KAI1950629.1 nuclear pore complex subunit [Ophidiomyces ophidiicola]KAI1972592.1 nuclear pore complex subunit [Ophidiomyces ophidiicola]KAI2009228.1 nuclear pore complex subunit [Ophidiomyces ophidiicola]KAI2018369.1 nuclear pore complex subunit [Ophidiomyces ophidiicola]
MFSGLSQSSAAGSLFSTAPAQPAKRGFLDSPVVTPANRPSPFATAPASSTVGTGFASQPVGSSIYSNTNPATGTNTAPTAPQSQFGGSIFSQPLAQNTQAQAHQQPTAALGQSVLSTQPTQSTQPAYFSSLLERGKKRPYSSTAKPAPVELPNLQLGLDDIRRTARGLGSNETPTHPGASAKAHYSLTASGITPGKVLHDLRTLDTQAPASGAVKDEEPFDPDNQKFLRRLQQRGRDAMVAESFARVRRDFDQFLEEKVNLNWDEQRQRIFEHFGLSPKSEAGSSGTTMRQGGAFGASKPSKFGRDLGQRQMSSTKRSVFGRSGLSKSVIGSTIASTETAPIFSPLGSTTQPADTRFLREKMGHFATKVQQFNKARMQDKAFPILHEFSNIEKLAISDVPRQLFEAYQALISITNEAPNVVNFSEPGVIRERQFSADYLDESANSNESVRMRKAIVEGSRKHLERAFYTEIENAVAKNPREAQLGGVPSIANKIRAYIRIKAARKDLASDGIELQMVDQDYCWVLIFYLLRCGFVSEAAEYVSMDQGFRSMDYKFVTYMTTYAQQRRLPRDLQQKLNGEYQQRLRNAPENTVDPYRMACYKIIGRCDLSQRRLEGMTQGVEDWMWLQFTLAREDSRAEEVAGDVFGLHEIQADIAEIGQRIFVKTQDTPGGYGTFFLLQILGGMFEQAVSYIGSFAPIDAVHFGIALDYYGLLRVSDFYTSGEELLSFTTKQLPQVNFALLITQYTREFRTGNVEAAVDYFTLICLNADLPGELGKSQASVCHEALREFILETRDFAKLLGDIKSDGTRIRGAIEQRLKLIKIDDQEGFLRTITIQAAAVADDKGFTADAVLLYHLAEDYDNVISILNRALSDAVAVSLGSASLQLHQAKPLAEDQTQYGEAGSSFSLMSVEDPVALAKNMIRLYESNAMYYQKIHQATRQSCGILLRMMEAKDKVEAGEWTQALDDINLLNILPLNARGSVTQIRGAAQLFSSLPPVISRNGGHIIMWSITCISRERERLQQGLYDNDMRRSLMDRMLIMAKDLMVFAGMIKYKLPPGVYEALAKAAGDMSVL